MANETLLLVEDDHSTAESLSAYLTERRFTVWMAGTGKEAIEIAKAEFPKYTVIDDNVPDMDFSEILNSLRALGMCQAILVLSKNGDDTLKCLELGADDYIIKPISFDGLYQRICAVYHS